MLWALLFSLIFSSGDDTIIINTEVKKLLRNNMIDGDRKEEALTLTKLHLKDVKDFDKDQKKRLKELHSLFKQRNSTSSDFLKLYEDYISALIIVQNEGISGRKRLQDLVTEDEWQFMLKSIDEDAGKMAEKKAKKRTKLHQKASKINKKAIKQVKNTQKRQIIEEKLKSYSKEYMDYIKYRDELNYYSNDVLRFQHSTPHELTNLLQERTVLRKKVIDEYIELHQVLVENTSEKEWTGVTRKVKRLF